MANENLNALMPEILSVMKDLASMLEKQDTTQERAKLDKPPKTGDDQKAIVGGSAPGFKPGEGIAKEFPTLPKRVSPQTEATEVNDVNDGTLLKEDEENEEAATEEEAPAEEPTEEGSEDESFDELKSILKSIASELAEIKKSKSTFSKADLNKAVRAEAENMLRKMGFNPSKPDVVKLTMGVDSLADVKKSEEIKDVKEVPIDSLAGKDLTPLSWRQINTLREQMGGFNPFGH